MKKNELDIVKIENSIKALDEDVQKQLMPMMKVMQENLPEVNRAKQNFGKRQSQLMDNMLTLNKATPIRNMRQVMSEVEKTQGALREGYFKLEKKKIEAQIKLRNAELEQDDLQRKLLFLEYDELCSEIESSKIYISGAVRRVTNYLEQYKKMESKVFEEQGITEFSEVDFEREEEEYHIKTAFNQGLTAAIARGGSIDEGNLIYLNDLGIHPFTAAMEMRGFLMIQEQKIQEGIIPEHQDVLDFLEDMYQKYKGCTTKLASSRGMTTFSETAVVEPKLLKE